MARRQKSVHMLFFFYLNPKIFFFLVKLYPTLEPWPTKRSEIIMVLFFLPTVCHKSNLPVFLQIVSKGNEGSFSK